MKTNRRAERDSKKADEQDSYSTERKTKENKKENKITPNRWQERKVKKRRKKSKRCVSLDISIVTALQRPEASLALWG